MHGQDRRDKEIFRKNATRKQFVEFLAKRTCAILNGESFRWRTDTPIDDPTTLECRCLHACKQACENGVGYRVSEHGVRRKLAPQYRMNRNLYPVHVSPIFISRPLKLRQTKPLPAILNTYRCTRISLNRPTSTIPEAVQREGERKFVFAHRDLQGQCGRRLPLSDLLVQSAALCKQRPRLQGIAPLEAWQRRSRHSRVKPPSRTSLMDRLRCIRPRRVTNGTLP